MAKKFLRHFFETFSKNVYYSFIKPNDFLFFYISLSINKYQKTILRILALKLKKQIREKREKKNEKK